MTHLKWDGLGAPSIQLWDGEGGGGCSLYLFTTAMASNRDTVKYVENIHQSNKASSVAQLSVTLASNDFHVALIVSQHKQEKKHLDSTEIFLQRKLLGMSNSDFCWCW